MSERPKDGVDPDATVIWSRDNPDPGPDPDATVMVPPQQVDDDATVMLPAGGLPAGSDPDATVMIDEGAGVLRAPAEPDPDATIAIPTPGRRRDVDLVDTPTAPPSNREAAVADIGALGGLNSLVAAANPVLAAVPQIRHTLRHPDPGGLRARLRESLDAFEQEARAAGCGEEIIAASSYALCALLDESAASTPWGASWAKQGLLAERHAGAIDEDHFFKILEKQLAEPAENLTLLEFLYVCLALGYEGRYRNAANGNEEAVEFRGKLLDQIRNQRTPYDGELSGHWRGVNLPAARPSGGLALWAAGSGSALLLSALYIGFSFSLGSLSDPVARDLAQLKAPELAAISTADLATPRVSEQLAAEIARGEVAVTDSAGQSTIVIRGDRLFASGSARLESGVEAVILRVAEALDRVPGRILVTGHTDDVPIRTARFPSNWELSTARAASVVNLMAGKMKEPARLRAEGVADSAPVVPNDSAANRARNRRVTIILR